MQKMVIRIAFLFLLAVWIAGPALIDVDPWDAFPDTGDHVIVFMAISSLCVGAACCLALLVFRLLMCVAAIYGLPFPSPLSEICRDFSCLQLPLRLPQPLRI